MPTAIPIANPQQLQSSPGNQWGVGAWQATPQIGSASDYWAAMLDLAGKDGGLNWQQLGYTGPTNIGMLPSYTGGDSGAGENIIPIQDRYQVPQEFKDWATANGYALRNGDQADGFRRLQLTKNGEATPYSQQLTYANNDAYNIAKTVVDAGLIAGAGYANMPASAASGGASGAEVGAGALGDFGGSLEAGAELGGTGVAGGSASTGNMALIESGLGTPGYGVSSAGTIGTTGGLTASQLAYNGIEQAAAGTGAAGAASGAGGGTLSTIGKTLTSPEALKLIGAGVGAIAAGGSGGGATGGDAAAALEAQRRAADNAYKLGQDQLDFQKSQWAEGKASRDQASATAQKVSDAMLASQAQADRIAAEYDAYRKGTFEPLEKQIVSEATAYDTPERRAAAAQAARADVDIGFSRQQDANARRLAAMGINPGSARSVAAMGGAGVEAAKAGAGASYMARKGIEDTGTAMKLNAASLGRNLPANQNASAQTAISAGNSAVNNATVPATLNQNAATSLNPAYTSAINAATSAGSLYGNNAAISQRGNESNSAAWGALGSTLGSWLGSSSGQNTINSISDWLSDENVKTDIAPVSDDEALEAVNATPVQKWRYDPAKLAAEGIAPDDGSEHIGAMAQDVNATMGEQAAPGGKRIDPITMAGVTMRGLQAVDKKVERLAKQVTSIASMVRSGRMEARA